MKIHVVNAHALKFTQNMQGGTHAEKVWVTMNRRVVNVHTRMKKRVAKLKAHIVDVELLNAEKTDFIDDLMTRGAEISRRLGATIERQSEELKQQAAEIENLKLELQDVLQRAN